MNSIEGNSKATNSPGGEDGTGASEDVFVFPTTLSQRRFWLLDQLTPGHPALNVPLFARLKGHLDRPVMERAINEIVRRHEILRTSFRTENGEPVQVIHGERTITPAYWDISDLPASEREARIHQLTLEEGARSFSLVDGPLIRAGLIKVRDDEHIIMLTMHHIGCDGWSNGILMREVAQIYSALLMNKPGLPELPLQFADFAQWQKEWLETPAAAEQRKFWNHLLKGILPTLNLPTDRPRRAARSYRGTIDTLLLPKNLAENIKGFCTREDLTPFMLFFAIYGTLLYRYSGNTDVVIGSPAANRNQTDLEGLIGLFSNPLPLRLDFSNNPTLRELLEQVRDMSWEAFANQGYPFEKLLEDIQTDPTRPGVHWLQNYFVFQKAFMVPQQMPDLTLTPQRSISPGAMFEWALGVLERAEGIRLQLEYNTDLYDQATVNRMLQHFQHVLEIAVSDLNVRVDQLPLLVPREYQQLVVDWNRSRLSTPSDRCVHELFEEQVRRNPEAPALKDSETELTYSQLNIRANRLAHHLRGIGVGPQTRVGLAVNGLTAGYLVGVLAVLKAGGCCVELDLRRDASVLSKSMQECGLEVLISTATLPATLRSPDLRHVNLETDAAAIASAPETDLSNVLLLDQPACVRFAPNPLVATRGAVFSHRALLNSAWVAMREFGLHDHDSVAFTSHEMLPALLAGATLVTPVKSEKFNPEAWMQWIRSRQVTVASLSTPCWHEVVNSCLRKNEFATGSLRLMILNGGRISPSALRAWGNATAARIQLIDCYQTPASIGASSFSERIATDDPTNRITISRPAPNTRLYLLDANLQPVPVGVPGDVYVAGESIAMGYMVGTQIHYSEFVADRFSGKAGQRIIKTGARGRFLASGGIELLGTIEELARTNGFRLELFEIWRELSQHPSVWDALILPRENSGKKDIIAYVVGRNESRPESSELRTFLEKQLPIYMVPAAIVVLDAFPLTTDGEIDTLQLPMPEVGEGSRENVRDSKVDRERSPLMSRTPIESELARIWCDVLGLKQAGIQDNFFESGGDSLLAFRLISKIKRDLNIDLPVATLFRHPTISELVKALPSQTTKERKPELIQLNASKTGPDIFFLIGEGSFELFNLINHFGKDMSIYASMTPLSEELIKGAVKKQFVKPPRLDDLAAAHVALIKNHKSNRPLVLTGYCYGGLLAYEVARQLNKLGIKVDAVIMLDTWLARPSKLWKKKTYIKGHLLNTLKQGPMYVWRKSRSRVILEKENLASTLQLAIHGDYSNNIPWHIIERIYTHAMFSYVPEKLPTKGVQLISKNTWFSNEYRKKDDTLGAGPMFEKGVEVLDVPGDHITVLNEGNLKGLAECYRQSLVKIGMLP